MRRWVILVLLATTACSGSAIAGSEPAPTTSAVAAPPSTTSTTTPAPTTTTSLPPATTTTTQPPVRQFVSWMPSGLPPEFGDIVRSVPGVSQVSVVGTGTLHIASSETSTGVIVDQPPEGFVIPVTAAILDPGSYRQLYDDVAVAAISGLAPDEVILSESSASVRRLGVGDWMVFEGGETRRVGAVVADVSVGSSEVFTLGDDSFVVPGSGRGYALIEFDGATKQLEGEILDRLPEGSLLRVRGPDGDEDDDPRRTVRSQLFFKQEFGEFAYRPGSRGRFEIDPAWLEANIIEVEIPLLGKTVCHRKYAALLTEVMQGLDDHGLDGVIDQRAFRGCWNSRYIGGSTRLSRHAWGAAADINFGNDLDGGPGSPVNEELLERMLAVGIRSGHLWTNPDPGHFEYYGPGA